MLNGGSLTAHLWMLYGVLAFRGASSMQDERALSARCVAKVLLEILPHLVTVRAQPYTASPLSWNLLRHEDAVHA